MHLMDLVTAVTKKAVQPKGICAINFVREGLTFALIERDVQKKPRVKTCDFIQAAFEPLEILRALSTMVKKYDCQGFLCNWVLQAKDYNLISIPNLPVSAEELPMALKFNIKDQIDFPVTEAVIDYFKVPYLSKAQNEELIYVAVARKNYLDLVAKLIVEAGLVLNVIEIPEFALRNIAELFAEKGQSIGIIETNGSSGAKLIIMRDSFVYLVRKIDIELHKSQSNEELHVFITEIQRSCDYYENGLGQAPLTKFLLLSADASLPTQLMQGLGFPVELLDISSKLAAPPTVDAGRLQQCLYAIGGALRQEEVDNEATS